MKIIERIIDALGLYDDSEDEILEEEEVVEKKPAKIEKVEKPEPKFEPAPKKSLFSKKEGLFGRKKADDEVEEEASAPVAVKEAKVSENSEFSTESYDAYEQRKLDKQSAKAEKKAEREALLTVANAEKQMQKDAKAAEKAAK